MLVTLKIKIDKFVKCARKYFTFNMKIQAIKGPMNECMNN